MVKRSKHHPLEQQKIAIVSLILSFQRVTFKCVLASSASSQMHSKERKEVRVGEGCQVALTDVESSYIGDDNYENYCEDLDVMVWNGGKDLKDEDVVEYIQHAAKTHRIPVDKVDLMALIIHIIPTIVSRLYICFMRAIMTLYKQNSNFLVILISKTIGQPMTIEFSGMPFRRSAKILQKSSNL